MNIGVNLSFIIDNIEYGIASYAINVLKGIQKIDELHNFKLIVRKSFSKNAKSMFPEAKIIVLNESKLLEKNNFYKDFFISHYYDMVQMKNISKSEKFDLMFYPFNSVSNNMNLKIPIVMTVHDLFHKNHPEFLSKKHLFYVNIRYKNLMYGADHIIAISNHVSKDIIKFFPKVDQKKLNTIYNPVIMDKVTEKNNSTATPFILSVNSFRLHKNHITILKAFNIIKDNIPHRLVFVGSGYETLKTLNSYIHEHKLEERVEIRGSVTEKERNTLYREAALFVSTSIHEGFGMTPVEAIMSQTPVITTSITSLYESTCGLASYLDSPYDTKRLSSMILDVISKEQSQDDLMKNENILRNKYDYEKTGKIYFELFRSLV